MRGETDLAELVCLWNLYAQDFNLLRISALVMLSLLACALAQDRTFSWNGHGEPSQNDTTNATGNLKYLLTVS